MAAHTQPLNRLILLAALASVILVLVAWRVQVFIGDNHRSQQGEMLVTMLDTSHQAVRSWGRAHMATAVIWANSQEVMAHARRLLAVPREPRALVSAPEQRRLRERLQPLLDAMGYRGYFIIGPGDINLSSTRDENIGVPNLLAQHDGHVLARMWRGEAALSVPRRSDVPLPDAEGRLREGLPTMFVGAPIHGEDGQVMALLTFRIDPAEDFTRIFRQGRLGRTGRPMPSTVTDS